MMSTRLWQVTKIVFIRVIVVNVNIAPLDLLLGSLVHETAVIPARMIMEHCMMVAILHANVGTEVGAFILQEVVIKFNAEFKNVECTDDDDTAVTTNNLIGLYHIISIEL